MGKLLRRVETNTQTEKQLRIMRDEILHRQSKKKYFRVSLYS